MVRVTQVYNLEAINRNLANEWHPTKNVSLTPRIVAPYSRKRVWWICSKGHEWKATISNRSNGTGCPYCSGRKVCEDNCLETVNPSLANEWHPTKNGTLTARDVTPGSVKKIWWICKQGHEWKASVHNRNYGYGCPRCAGRKEI